MLSFVKNVVPMLFVALTVAVFGTEVFAEGGPVDFKVPEVDFSSVGTSMTTALTNVATIGIGVGLSVWALLMIPRVFKRSAH